MNWKHHISKFSGKMTKEKWLLLLLLGVFLMILSFPPGGGGEKESSFKAEDSGQKGGVTEAAPLWTGEGDEKGKKGAALQTENQMGEETLSSVSASVSGNSYEAQLEARIREILKSVEGVGKVEVMVVLKSSSEKVMRIDRSDSSNITKETDSSGGQREVTSSQAEESTVLSNSGSGTAPVIEKELSPEISGIIISAEGGGSPSVKAEISEAMEALFGLPPHKIKVLKRVE